MATDSYASGVAVVCDSELANAIQRSMQEYFTRHQEDFPGLAGGEEVSNLAAKLVVWLLEDPRVLDYFPYGVPHGPLYTERQGNLEALVTDEYILAWDPHRSACTWQGLGRLHIRLWRAGVPKFEAWEREDGLTAADVGDAFVLLKNCRAWIRARQKRPHRGA